MKKFALVNVLIFSFFLVNSQNWEVINETSDYKIEKKTVECNDDYNGIYKEFVFLKFSNLTQDQLTINYRLELYYDDVCRSCNNSAENNSVLVLEPSSSVEGSCDSRDRRVKIFSKFLNYSKAELTDFNVVGVKIEKL